MYLAELENTGVSYCYLARDAQGRAVGFCSFWRVLDELHINNIAVLAEFRRAGIATALLTHVLAEGARLGARRATLEVRRSNEPARSLYERFGFIVAGVRQGYYTKPVEDALVLWRDRLDTDVVVSMHMSKEAEYECPGAGSEGRAAADRRGIS